MAQRTMNTTWSLVTTGLPWWAALTLSVIALGVTWWWQERHPGLRIARALAALVVVALVVDPALSRTVVRDEAPPVAVVMDVSGSMSVIDRHLPADRLLDLAEVLRLIEPGVRSTGPRAMAKALMAWQSVLPAAATGGVPAADLRNHAAALHSAAAAAAGYRDAELLCRDAATLAEKLAKEPKTTSPISAAERTRLSNQGAAISSLLPRLATEQAAGDAALIAGWRAAQDLASRARSSAIDRLLHNTRGHLATRLTREVVLPDLLAHADVSTWALAERLAPMQLGDRASDAAGTDFAVLSDLSRTWATGRTPGAVVVLSDGRNHGGDPRPALRSLAARGARVLMIAVGDEAPPDDPALLTLEGPPVVRAGATITLTADIRRGRDLETHWDLVIQVDDVITQRIPLSTTGSLRVSQRIEIPAGASGLRQCSARLEPTNDRATGQPRTPTAWLPCPVRITESPIRILVAEALPRWETRALVAALEADPLCVVERRYLQGPGAVAAAVPATALMGADAVVLGDLLPTELPAEDQERLAAFVADGGFLMVVAGPRGMPDAFPLGPLADVLPVRAQRGAPFLSGTHHALGFSNQASLSLTQTGEQHPVTRLLEDTDLNRRLWAALPAPAWVADGVVATPDAEVLAEASSGPQATLPVVAIRALGVGRVLWLGAPETWHWRTFERGRAHIAFWHQALRWGLAGRPRGVDPRLRVAVDPPRIDTHGTAEVLIAGDPLLTTLAPTAEVIDANGKRSTLSLQDVGSSRWRGVVADLPPGRQQIVITSGTLIEERDLLVRPRAANELGDPSADPLALRALALDCGGEVTTAAGLRDAMRHLVSGLHPDTVTTVTTWRLTNGPWLALIVALLLCGEWWWRKQSGMP